MADVPETRNGPGWVVMTHPDLKGPGGKGSAYAEVTEEAFKVAYEPKGWVKASAKTTATPKAGS